MTSRNLALASRSAIPEAVITETNDAIERARKRLGWSQERTARELRVGKTSFVCWESGEREPKLSWLRRNPQFFSAVMRELGYEPVREQKEAA